MTPEEKREYNKKYYLENRGKIKKRTQEYYNTNKEYRKERARQYYLENKEEIQRKDREDYHTNKEYNKERRKQYCLLNKDKIRERTKTDKYALGSIRNRAKRVGLPFNLTIEDVIPPQFCPVFGLELVRGNVWHSSTTPSVDRIIPSLGYIKGNVQVISSKANAMKSNATPEELVLFAKWVQRTYPEMF